MKKWSDETMNEPIIEERFEYKGFPCVVLFQPMGYRTGYVGLLKGSQYYNVDYNDIPVDCHCGLTYARSYLFEQTDKDTWWIGFDCGHICDSRDIESVRKYYGDEYADKIYDSFNYLTEYAVERSLDYVKENCKHIVDQLLREEVQDE